jgi:DNA-binding XRE family transcriptional regulator
MVNTNDTGDFKTISLDTKESTVKLKKFTCGDVVRLESPMRNRFDVLLNRIGLSQNKLADELGVSSGTMSRIANGEWFPSSKLMTRICKTLDCPSHVIFGDSKYWKDWHDNIVYEEQNEA